MKHLLLSALLLVGCSTSKTEPVVVETKVAPVDSYAKANDLAAGKAAAAVQVAKETLAAGKTKATDNELSVAQSNLPRPSQDDLGAARKRAESLDDKAYTAAISQGEKLQKQIDDLWTNVEKTRAADKAKADAEITKLKTEFEEERRGKMMLMYGGAGVLTCLCGVGLIVFGTKKLEGVLMFISGVVLGSLSILWDSPYFIPVFGGACFLITVIVVSVAWSHWKGRNPAPTQPQDDTLQGPPAQG